MKVKFIYQPPIGGEHDIYLAGSFNNWQTDELKLQESNGIYEIEIDLAEGRYEYKFIVDGDWKLDNAAEAVEDKFGNINSIIDVGEEKIFKQEKKLENFHTPNWVKDGIIYQIFTDRFCNGDSKLNPDFSEWYYQKKNELDPAAREQKYEFVKDWNDTEKLKTAVNRDFLFYGGDLLGVKKKLDYLVELGVTIIYFNPLVKAASNHKYDAYDYYQVDPHFGSNEDFIDLVQACHQKEIKVIVDFAFNHVGIGFFAFQDSIEKGKNSKYYHWFDWNKWPLPEKIDQNFNAKKYYQCWWGHAIMPDLNFDLKRFHPDENFVKDIAEAEVNWDIVNYLLKVCEFWLTTFDIDGFRLDIPNEVPFWFWQKFRKKVKNLKPDAYLVGEIWHNAEEWINNDYFDAVMNYKYFKDPVYDFFCLQKISPQNFMKKILAGLRHYPKEATMVMMNLLDSHDTFRFLEAARGNINKLKLALIFQMTTIGTPHIFYGDEVGMRGGHDPDNRRPFDWKYFEDPQKITLRNFYRKLISLRKEYKALRRGELKLISTKNDLLFYQRKLGKEELFILINNNQTSRKCSDINQTFYDLISENFVKTKEIPEMSGMILKK